MVQSGGGQRLILEALQLLRVQGRGKGQHLQRYPAMQRYLHGFIDNPHAAAADLSDQTKVAELP